MVPVNLRPLDEAWKLGNRFGLAPLVLPIGIDNPVEPRLRGARAHERAEGAATSRCWPSRVLAVAGLLAKPVQDDDPRPVLEEGDGGDDQRAGPGRAAEVLRRDAEQTMFWVPASGDIGVGRQSSSPTAAACSSG